MSENSNTSDYTPRLRTVYNQTIRMELKEDLGLANVMQVPRLEKIVVNMGVGEGSRDAKVLQAAEEDLGLIVGQRPRRNKSRISVAAFKLRQGMPVGCSVTLRGNQMYEFLERLIYVAIPRIRDFRGLSTKSFDGRGNYNFGIREHTIFTEVDTPERAHTTTGMNITMVTSAADDKACLALLTKFGMPLRKA